MSVSSGYARHTLTLLLCLAIAAGCARPSAAVPADYLQVDISTSPATLDPRLATDAISTRIDELIYQSMVRIDAQGNFAGDLAQNIENPAPTRYIFHLRRGIRFSDGRLLTARDVKYTYDSILDSRTLSPKRGSLAEMVSLSALDDYTVAIDTRGPYAPALELATYGIVPYGTAAGGGPGPASAPAGSGPFMVARFVRDEAVTLVRNPNHPRAKGMVAGILFKVVPDPTVRALELVEGTCDFAENDGVQLDLIPYLASRPNLRIVKSPGTTYQYLAFNFRDPRLRDLRVRQAIAYAIDRQAIVDSVLHHNARVATGLLAPENWAYDGAVARYAYDPAAARRLLEEAGYSNGANGHPLRLVYNTTPEGAKLAEIIQAMLKRVGIVVSVHTNEWATFYSDLSRGNFDLASSQWVGISDPHAYYSLFDSSAVPPLGNNRGAYTNPAMDKLVEAGNVALDPAARRVLYGKVQELAAIDLPYVSLWWLDNVAVMNRGISGFEPYRNGSLISLAAAGFVPPVRRMSRHD